MIACPMRVSCTWSDELWAQEIRKYPEEKKRLPLGFPAVQDPRYILRPEAIESLFILYRVTGDTSFQDMAWEMFSAIRRGTETEYANAAIQDVTTTQFPLPKEDYMEVSIISIE